MGFPDKKRLDKVRAKLEKAEGTLMIAPDATPLEKFRWDICQKFLQYKAAHHMTQDELAEAIGVDKAKMSKILHHRIDEFSTDRLIKLYQELNPKVKIKVS
ncbi:MAG TPA: XRE family transcriptional regulator [Bdellovibrionales bacterium]|nr:XRE family transcriptional regulator [Bdellovibrionales bacterium]